MEKMPDHYRIKYRQKGTTGRWKYGLVYSFGEEAEANWKLGRIAIEDAVKPKGYRFYYKDLEIVDIPYGSPEWDSEAGRMIPGDEFDAYVQKEYDKAKAKSKRAKGIVGKMLSVGVADGSAYYVVTKDHGRTVTVEWRGFCLDRYTDSVLGWECTLDKRNIEDRIYSQEKLEELFAKR